MDERNEHMDNWLKAAAREGEQQDAGMDLKRQGWSQLASRLEGEKKRPVRLRPSLAAMVLKFLLPLSAAAGITAGAIVLWKQPAAKVAPEQGAHSTRRNHPHSRPHPAPAGQDSAVTDTAFIPAPPIAHTPGRPQADTIVYGQRARDNYVPKDTLSGSVPGIPSRPGRQDMPLTATDKRKEAGQENNDNNNKKDNAPGNNNLANRPANPGIASPVASSGNVRTPAATAAASLSKLVTRNPFKLSLPALSGSGGSRGVAPSSFSTRAGRAYGDNPWSLQAGLLSSLQQAYGLRLGVLYQRPVGINWYLQPHVGAIFLNGYDKQFTHRQTTYEREDSVSAANRYKQDSITTVFTASNTLIAEAGVNVGYTKGRFSFSTGLKYNLALHTGGKKDTSYTSSSFITDSLSTQLPASSPAFKSRKLPGYSNLSWNIDAAYYLSPRLQIGINYRLIWWKANLSGQFLAPAGSLPDNSQLELFIRVPLGK